MKKLLLIFVAVIVALSLFAQDVDVDERVKEAMRKSEEAQKKVEKVMQELEEDGVMEYEVEVLVDDNERRVVINTSDSNLNDKPFIGVTYSNLTLQEAAEIGYEYFYGIRIDTVVHGSPAYYYKLRKGDILMKINDDKIKGKDNLGTVISFYRVGEKVDLHVFRNGQEIQLDFVFGTRKKVFDLEGNLVKDDTKSVNESTKGGVPVKKHKKVDYGSGTIAWMPTWYVPDVEDINKLLYGLGFEEETYSEDGIFMNGIGLKGNIGGGWFIGGQYTGYYTEKTTRHLWDHVDVPSIGSSTTVERKAKYWIRYGGLSFDRRFILSKSIYAEAGVLITWGMNELKVSQEAESDSPDYNFNEDLNEYLDDYYDLYSSITMKNYGFLAEPRISLGWRINDWLSFKAEAAYLQTVYMSGWEGEANGHDINIDNKPDTNMDGLTLSIGPWFGF